MFLILTCTIKDKFSGGWAILMIGALECICIGWVYGKFNLIVYQYYLIQINFLIYLYLRL